jgi:hypothetical protein
MSHADKDGTKHGEHIRLHECDKQFETVHEKQHDYTKRVQSQAITYAHVPSKEYHASETQYNGMTSHHVGEETYHQRKRLCEDTEQLYHRHKGNGKLQGNRNFWPKYVFPILLIAKDVDNQHRGNGQEHGYVDVTRDVCSAWEHGNKPNHVTSEDEKEHRQQERSVAFVLPFAHGRPYQVVVDVHHEHLHQANETLGSSTFLIYLLIPACARQEDREQNRHNNPYLSNGFGYA